MSTGHDETTGDKRMMKTCSNTEWKEMSSRRASASA